MLVGTCARARGANGAGESRHTHLRALRSDPVAPQVEELEPRRIAKSCSEACDSLVADVGAEQQHLLARAELI
eukprot:1070728-Prymnesium_polylepis.1